MLSKMSCISINIGKFVFNVVHVYQTHLEVTLPAVFVTLPEPVKEFLFPNGTEITPGIMPALDKEKRRAEVPCDSSWSFDKIRSIFFVENP